MGLFNKLFGKKSVDTRLEGTWISDRNDEITINSIGDVKMTFTSDGKLIYEIMESDTAQRINLIYWISGDTLFTDQPSHPRKESTKYRYEDHDTLILESEGTITKFKKQ